MHRKLRCWPPRLTDREVAGCRAHSWLLCLEGSYILAVAPEENARVDGGNVLSLFCAQCRCGLTKLGLGAQKDQCSYVHPGTNTLGFEPERVEGLKPLPVS